MLCLHSTCWEEGLTSRLSRNLPHLASEEATTKVRDHLEASGYHFSTNLTVEGRGGAALIWRHRWSLQEAIPLGSRTLTATLTDTDGQQICVTSAHFHHTSAQIMEQWHAMTATLACIPCLHKILLVDHNSLIVPSRDSQPFFEDKTALIVEARETKIKALQQLGLLDAYLHVHNQNWEHGVEHPEGYTFGFGVNDPQIERPDSNSSDSQAKLRHNLRPIDRVHMSPTLLPHVSEAFVAFIARVDHKAALIACSPPSFDMTSIHFKCP